MKNNIFIKNVAGLKKYAINHKIISGIVLLVILYFGYLGFNSFFKSDGQVQYVLAPVSKGSIIVSITGSGQVSAYNQVDIKPKVSGDVVYVGIVNGQEVKAGTLIAQLDDRDAQKSVRDAEVNLESAKISLQKLEEPADALSVIQAENSLTQAKTSLEKAYDDGATDVSNAFLDMPSVVTGLQDILSGTSASKGTQDNISYFSNLVTSYNDNVSIYKNDAADKYKEARIIYDNSLNSYKITARFTDEETTEKLISDTYNMARSISEAVKSVSNFLSFVKDRLTERQYSVPQSLTTYLSSLSTYTSTVNSNLSTLFSIKNTIVNSKMSIEEKTESLAKLKEGVSDLDLASQKLSLKQKENALLDVQEKLSDYYIRALFNGTIVKVNVKKSDAASSGTAVATLVTRQKIAELSLNEIDAAKIKVDQKAMLSFDAVDGLNIAGKVAEVDAVGTVSQGVVTYNVKISFDTQDDRVKSGMSVSAAIVIDFKQDVLIVPNSAIKSGNNISYAEMLDKTFSANQGSQGVASDNLPKQQIVETGITDDTNIEIISGLKEGDQIIIKTINSSTSSSSSQQTPSILGAIGGNNKR